MTTEPQLTMVSIPLKTACRLYRAIITLPGHLGPELAEATELFYNAVMNAREAGQDDRAL